MTGVADVELLPLHLLEAFSAALKGERGELDAWLEVNNEDDVRLHVEAYARANIAHATAAKDAENEALRAEVAEARDGWHMANGTADLAMKHRDMAEARAERLAEALRGLKDLMLERVKWEPCDCGCPQQRTPDGPHSVTWLRAAQQVEIAISKAEDRG